MGDKACSDSRTWRLLKRRARNSEFVIHKLMSVRSSATNVQKMRKKNTRRTVDDNDQNLTIPITSYELLREERVAMNNDFLSRLGLVNRRAEKSKQNAEEKTNKQKHTMLEARRSQRLAGIGNGDEEMDISHENVRMDMEHGNVKIDRTPTVVLPDIAHSDEQPDEYHEDKPLESDVPPHTTVVTSRVSDEIGGSTINIDAGSRDDVHNTIKRQRLSQALYRSTKKKAKERVSEGKKPFLVEVSNNGEPIGYNAARWATELGIRCRAHLDICKSNFKEQDPQNVELVIQKMDNSFDTVGGQITRKHYKNKMRILMNNFRYNCRKIVIEGKDKLDSTLSLKQWEAIKESMRSEDYMSKSNRGKRARDSVRAEYSYGRGGLQAKMDKIGVENTNEEANVEDVVNYMTAVDHTKSNNNIKWKTTSSTNITQPSVQHPVRAPSKYVNTSEGMQHIMDCLHSLTEKVSELSAFVQPIVSAWDEHSSMGLNQNIAPGIDVDHDELVDNNVQHTNIYDDVQSIHMEAKQKREDIDNDYAKSKECMQDIHGSSHFKLGKYIDNKLKEGDKVRVLDPYDGDVAGIGRIHSLSISHGVNLVGTGDANVNIITVTNNIPLVYTDKVDGAIRLKEKMGTFTRWPLQYLQKVP